MSLRTSAPGQLAVVGPAGITWQEFTWGELLDGLKKDLYLDSSSLDLTALRVPGSAWIAPTLLNSWANQGAEATAYLKDPLGFVHIKGRIGGGANATTVFTLPPGFRPGGNPYQALGNQSTGNAQATVQPGGAVIVEWVTVGTNIGLSGINFLAEN